MPKRCFKNIWQPIVKKIRDYNASGTIQNRDFHDIQFLWRWIECLPLSLSLPSISFLLYQSDTANFPAAGGGQIRDSDPAQST